MVEKPDRGVWRISLYPEMSFNLNEGNTEVLVFPEGKLNRFLFGLITVSRNFHLVSARLNLHALGKAGLKVEDGYRCILRYGINPEMSFRDFGGFESNIEVLILS